NRLPGCSRQPVHDTPVALGCGGQPQTTARMPNQAVVGALGSGANFAIHGQARAIPLQSHFTTPWPATLSDPLLSRTRRPQVSYSPNVDASDADSPHIRPESSGAHLCWST